MIAASVQAARELAGPFLDLSATRALLLRTGRSRCVTFFGGSRLAADTELFERVRELSALLALNGWRIVTGAGPGVMEAARLGAGDQCLGIDLRLDDGRPAAGSSAYRHLAGHRSLFSRKHALITYADAWVFCPGGLGTADELFDVLTLMTMRKIPVRPLVLFDTPDSAYWQQLLGFIDEQMISPGLARNDVVHLIEHSTSVAGAREALTRFYRVYGGQHRCRNDVILHACAALPQPTIDALSQLRERYQSRAPSAGSPPNRKRVARSCRACRVIPAGQRVVLPGPKVHASYVRAAIDLINRVGNSA